MVRIPSEYQEVEYLESTGTQFIDLPFGFYITDEIQMRGAMTKAFQDKYLVAPKQWNTDNNRFSMLGGLNSSFMFTLGQQGTPNNILNPAMKADNYFHTATYANKIFTVVDTGSIADMTTKSFGSETANIRLFYGYTNNTHGKIAFYHHKKADGTEINLIPCYHKSSGEIGMYDTVSKQFYTNSGTGTFLKGNDVTYNNINLLESRRRILLNTPHIETVSDTVVSFKTDVATKLKGCKIHFAPIQEGEGNPSPDNVRPIRGWDGVTVTRCGKNLIDENFLQNADNYHVSGPYGYWYTDWIYLPSNTQLKFTWSNFNNDKILDKNCNLFVANANQYIINNGNYRQYTAFTTKSDGSIRFGIFKASSSPYADGQELLDAIFNNGKLQLELGSKATDYEPYNGTSITIPFPQTIYGGYVDLVNGEIVEEQLAVTLDGDNVKCNYGSYELGNFYGAGWVYAKPAGLSVDNSPGAHLYLCDKLPRANLTTSHYVASNRGGLYYIIRVLAKEDYPDGLTNTEVKDLSNEWLKSNPLTVVYPLATPNTYPIDPQTLKTLRGMNNIWSDANGNIEVGFYTH